MDSKFRKILDHPRILPRVAEPTTVKGHSYLSHLSQGLNNTEFPISNQEIQKLLVWRNTRTGPTNSLLCIERFYGTGKNRRSQTSYRFTKAHVLQSFKMESIDLVKSTIRRGDYMISIDFNQAFYHAESQQSYFAFDFRSKQYCFTCLLFGLTASFTFASISVFIK